MQQKRKLKPRILLLTEGGKTTGFGHIVRLISLFDAFLEKKIDVKFAINGDDSFRSILNGRSYKIVNWIDVNNLFSLMEDRNTVVVDSYLADCEIYKKISKSSNLAVFIDDNKRIDYPKGLLINGSIYAEKLNYCCHNINFLLGSRYVLLRKEFWSTPKKNIQERVQTILIMMGGSDIRNLTPSILEMINLNYPKLHKKIIIGIPKQILQVDKEDNIEIFNCPKPDTIKKIMLKADIAVSSAGQTLNELAKIGLPTIAVAVSKNQLNNVKGWKEAGFIKYAGWWGNKNLYTKINKYIKDISPLDVRLKMSHAGKKMIDGKGSMRLANAIVKHFYENSIS